MTGLTVLFLPGHCAYSHTTRPSRQGALGVVADWSKVLIPVP